MKLLQQCFRSFNLKRKWYPFRYSTRVLQRESNTEVDKENYTFRLKSTTEEHVKRTKEKTRTLESSDGKS